MLAPGCQGLWAAASIRTGVNESVDQLRPADNSITAAPLMVRSLRIAFFIEGMSASGVDTSTQLLAAALRARGHHVVLFVPWKERATALNYDTVVQLPAFRISTQQPVYWSVPVSPSTFDRFRRDVFDLIHVHTSTTINLLAWQVSNVLRLPIVYTYHTMSVEYIHYLGRLAEALEGIVNPAIERFDRLVCNQASAIVAPSRKAERYLAQIGVKPPVTVVPNGVDLGAFRPAPSNYLQERLAIGQERKILLFVGRLNHEKRPLLAYACFQRIHAEDPSALLVMAGTGALRDELVARIEADGMGDSVRLLGAATYAEMPLVYNSAHIWISTSVSEVHPMVAIESAACGLPAVAWSDTALEDVVQPEVTGLLAQTEDAFVAAALTLLRDEPLRARMGLAAAERAPSFSVATTAQRMTSVYHTVLADSMRVAPVDSATHGSPDR